MEVYFFTRINKKRIKFRTKKKKKHKNVESIIVMIKINAYAVWKSETKMQMINIKIMNRLIIMKIN